MHSFRAFGVLGLCVATTVAMALAMQVGLSCTIALVLLATGLATFLVLAFAAKILTGSEVLVYYHHEVSILLVSGTVLSLSGLPVLPYLDLNILWLGMFLICGRGGCLMVGCCHGKPFRWGVQYTGEHAADGFPTWYVGVRLFPVQALESLLMLGVVGTGCWLFLQARPPGTVLATCIVMYGLARLWLEELRGDDTRRYWMNLSEAQWTSLLLACANVAGEWRGHLPHSAWHDAVAGAEVLSALFIACRHTRARALALAGHSAEIARIVALPLDADGAVSVEHTSLTVRISRQRLERCGAHGAIHYCLSGGERGLEVREAGVLARTIAALGRQPVGNAQLLRGGRGVYHLILPRVGTWLEENAEQGMAVSSIQREHSDDSEPAVTV